MYKVTKPAGIFWARDMLKHQQQETQHESESDKNKSQDFQARLDQEIDKLRGVSI